MEYDLIKFPTLLSTNFVAAEKLKNNEIQRDTIIYTDFQEEGRGQGDHHWHSGPGLNLMFSWIIFPAFLSASSQFHLSKLVSIALAGLLKGYSLDVAIKWPNDILVSGRKIAGVLIEHAVTGARIKSSIIGVGLNVNQSEFPEFDIPATSLLLETGSRHNLPGILHDLVEQLYHNYRILATGQSEILDQAYTKKLFWRDRLCRLRTGNEVIQARIKTVNDFGELIVEVDGGGELAFGHHEVEVIYA